MCKTDYRYGGGGGGKNVPKIDYVICERPLILPVKYIKTVIYLLKAESQRLLVLKRLFLKIACNLLMLLKLD